MENIVHMIPHPLSYTDLFLLLFFVFMVMVMIWKKTQGPKIAGKLPPGPLKLPIVGNLHQLAGRRPHAALRDLARKHGPLMYIRIGQVPSVVVSSQEIAKEVLVTHDPVFTDRPKRLATRIMWYNYEDVAFAPYGDYWKQMRKICIMELLGGENVRSFCHIREDENWKLIGMIRSNLGVPINMTDLIYAYSHALTCRAAFGSLCRDNQTMIHCLKAVFPFTSGFQLADIFPSLEFLGTMTRLRSKVLKLHRAIDAILDDVLNQHIANHRKGKSRNAESGGEDLIDVLLRLKESGSLHVPISNYNVKAVIFDMFAGGTDTTSSATLWAMSELLRHPDVMARVQREVRDICKGKMAVDEEDIKKLNYLKMVIKETLRLHPPIPFLPRVCRKNSEINGYFIPEDTEVNVNVWAIARDPEYWEDAESFKPERYEEKTVNYTGTHYEYIPFGTGRRMCPGLAFGLATVELPLANLLFHFNWSLPKGMEPDDLDMDEVFGLAMARKNDLNIVATAYDSWGDSVGVL